MHKVTNSAFTQARSKLKHTAFIEMDNLQTDFFYQNTDYKTWNGFRLVAIDGSKLLLPYTEKLHKIFGPEKINQNAKKVVLALISEAFDPLNNIIIDSCIGPSFDCERNMMLQHLEKFQKGDLAILDRGYPAFWVYKAFLAKGVDFCIRVQTKSTAKFIDDFIESGKKQEIVYVYCTCDNSKKKCKELNLDTEPIKCRLVRIELESGQTEVLITSLIDIDNIPYDCFKGLYHLRWPVEENYKFLKCRVKLDKFSGETEHAIYQDFYAKIFMANLTSILAYDANIEIEQKKTKAKCKYTYKVNWTNAFLNMKKSGFLLFIRKSYLEILKKLHELFQVNPTPCRHNRKFIRKKSQRRAPVYICYK